MTPERRLERDYATCDECGALRRKSSLVEWIIRVTETQAEKRSVCAEREFCALVVANKSKRERTEET